MGSFPSLSGDNLSVQAISQHYEDVIESLRRYYDPAIAAGLARFLAYTLAELAAELDDRMQESERTAILSLLAGTEAALRIDYILRCSNRKRDPLSRHFRTIYRNKAERASLEEDILEGWKKYSNAGVILSELKGAFKLRHWLAHGRYWTPKLGKRYDFIGISLLCEAVENDFPLLN